MEQLAWDKNLWQVLRDSEACFNLLQNAAKFYALPTFGEGMHHFHKLK